MVKVARCGTGKQTLSKNLRLPLASLMPPTSHPRPTWQRFTATSAVFLFLLLPTPLPSAGAQPASAPPVLKVMLIVMLCIFLILYIPLGFIVILRSVIYFTPYDVDAELVPAPPSDVFSSVTGTFGSFGAHLFYADVIVLVIIIFLVLLNPSNLSLVLEPEDYTDHSVRLRRLGPPWGLDLATIETFPTVVYSAVKGHRIGEASLECAVCLNDFEDDDTLRLIPKCNHAFHPDCISAWLASHRTCPVCRDVLPSQPAGDSAIQLAQSGTEPPLVEVKVEAATLDGGAPEGSPRQGQRERIQPPDLLDKNESGRFSNPNRTRGSGRIRRFPRSHSTGHSLIRPGVDTERFTLRLPAGVRKQLMPPEGCSTRGYRCEGGGSSPGRYFCRPDWFDQAAKSERWAFDGILPRVAADGGAESSSGSVQLARSVI